MKTLKLLSVLFMTGLLTMSMGFPTDLADKNKKEKKSAEAKRIEKKKPGIRVIELVEEEPVQALSMLVSSSTSKITVKVFDVKGVLVMKEEVSMNDFLSKNEKFALPSGSTFVMFHQNTAYYFMETGLLN
jgi:hypothetical protein